MAVYQIVKEGDPVLRQNAIEIKEITPSVIRLLDNLKDTLHSTSNGVGLAAPQIGISKRAVIVETEDDGLFEMVNPVIFAAEGEEEDWEGCLSVPGTEGRVMRAAKIRVRYMDRDGRNLEMQAQGFLARIIQHETDHLNGILYIDRAQVINRDLK